MNDNKNEISPMAQLLSDFLNERIIFCTRACEGIKDPKQYLAEAQMIKQEKADLLRALEDLVYVCGELSFLNNTYAMTSARKAIANAKGEP